MVAAAVASRPSSSDNALESLTLAAPTESSVGTAINALLEERATNFRSSFFSAEGWLQATLAAVQIAYYSVLIWKEWRDMQRVEGPTRNPSPSERNSDKGAQDSAELALAA
jgi:hypothetical protein